MGVGMEETVLELRLLQWSEALVSGALTQPLFLRCWGLKRPAPAGGRAEAGPFALIRFMRTGRNAKQPSLSHDIMKPDNSQEKAS